MTLYVHVAVQFLGSILLCHKLKSSCGGPGQLFTYLMSVDYRMNSVVRKID